MNTWSQTRESNDWNSEGLAEWVEGQTVYLSVVFSWLLDEARRRAEGWLNLGYQVRAGGPAVILNPDAFAGVAAQMGGDYPALARHNPQATFTTRGCPRRCSFCAVPDLEGAFRELPEWEPRPVVCDNNLLEASHRHFDRVVDSLKPLKGVDFNQGLDARKMTAYHADRLTELDLVCVRLAWDSTQNETAVMRAIELLRKAGIAKKAIRVYVLIGYKDDPEDALYRLRTIRAFGAKTVPMRYQPLTARQKNAYVGPGWTEEELQRYMRYWSNDRLSSIPFDEFACRGREPAKPLEGQLLLF